jgi:hypothetical protein
MGSFVEGETIRGWGVVRCPPYPWHFIGMFDSKEEAEAAAKNAGSGYQARYGDNQAGTDNFIWSQIDNPDA